MLRFTRVAHWLSAHRVYQVSFRGDSIGYVRCTERNPFRWEYAVSFSAQDLDGGSVWYMATPNRRDAAANHLLTLAGYDALPIVRRPRQRTLRDSLPSDGRVFGVEMELTGPSSSVIIDALVEAGIPMDARNMRNRSPIRYTHTNTPSRRWTLKMDSSVNGAGLELVSPKLSGQAGFDRLRRVVEVLNTIGATVDRSCGLHVHHDFRGMELETIQRQVLAMLDLQPMVLRMVAPSRRGNGACIPWNESQINSLRSADSLYELGRRGPRGLVNLWSYSIHGSVEVRAHAGTTNYSKIAAWVRFGQAVFAAAEARVALNNEDPAQLLVELMPFGVTAEDASWLLRFESAGESRNSVAARMAVLERDIAAAESVLEELPVGAREEVPF